MTCKEMQILIPQYQDGELDLSGTHEIEQHLKECASCSEELRLQQQLKSEIRTNATYHNAPQDLQNRILSSVRNETKSFPVHMKIPWGIIGAVASFAVLVFVVWYIWGNGTKSADDMLTQEILQSHVRSLMVNHLTDVLSSDQHTVKPWFDGKTDFSPVVKDLTNEGFPLLGGRLDYINNRSVAALVYQRHLHIINLFSWPATGETDSKPITKTLQGYNIISWNQSGMSYHAVSDLNTDELLEFIRLVQK